MQSIQEFYFWEKSSKDIIDVKRIYIDIADDLIAGILLSQIIYWNLPNDKGQTKLKVEKDGKLWLAKSRQEWWEEIRISPKQFDNAIKKLEIKNIVETKLFKFNGAPTKHISLNEKVILDLINNVVRGEMDFDQRVKSNLPKGENENSPKVKMNFNKRVNSLTETTTEITTKTTNIENIDICAEDVSEDKSEVKKESPSKAAKKIKYAEDVSMTEEEYKKLIEQYGHAKVIKMITKLENYKGSSGKKYKSDYRAILSWVVDAVEKDEKSTIKRPPTKFADYEQRSYDYDDLETKLLGISSEESDRAASSVALDEEYASLQNKILGR